MEELPPASPNRSGWPWTKQSKALRPEMPNGKPWPRISIVTPSYNQGQFIEETIRSVLLQNYPNLEYIVMDGGSTDHSVDIIKRYEPWLAYWVSEKDNGQADAIQKGFTKATGEIAAWLNSDDLFLPNALVKVGKKFSANPGLELAVGGGLFVDAEGRFIDKYHSFPQSFDSLLFIGQFFMQMSAFWRRRVFFEVGGVDTALRFCFDYDLFLRLTRRRQPGSIDSSLSAFRLHRDSKTSTIFRSIAITEANLIRERYGFEALMEEERKKRQQYFHMEYHLNKRRGFLRDIVYDPGFFLKQLKKKMSKC